MAIKLKHKDNEFGIGDVVRVHFLVKDTGKAGKKERIQVFEGTVIAIKNRGGGRSFTVRRIGVQKVGIEMIFPVQSPMIEKVEVVRSGKRGARRAKLYYIRDKSKKEIEKVYSRSTRKTESKKKSS